MKLRDLRQPQQDAYIQEMSELFMAYGQYKTMLSESQIDEAGAWQAVKSAFGKTMSGVKTANDAINKLGSLAQSTGPVQGFDAKSDALINKIGDANPKIKELATKYGEWAKKNPVKQGLIIGMLTAVATLVAGPGGGAAAGYVLRAGNELLKGEKMSTALGRGIKTAAFSWLAGLGVRELGELFAGMHIQANPVKGIRNLMDLELDFERIESSTGGRGGAAIAHIEARIPADMEGTVSKWFEDGKKLARAGKYAEAQAQFNQIQSYFKSPKYLAFLNDVIETNSQLSAQKTQIMQAAQQVVDFSKNAAAAMQGAVAGATAAGGSKSEPKSAAKGAPAPTTTKATAQPTPNAATPAAQPAATAPDKRAELKAKQQAWQAQQRRMGKLK